MPRKGHVITVYTGKRGCHPLLKLSARNLALLRAIPEEDWTPIPYWMDGADRIQIAFDRLPVTLLQLSRLHPLAGKVIHNLDWATACKTLRRRCVSRTGRITRTARRLTLQIPNVPANSRHPGP